MNYYGINFYNDSEGKEKTEILDEIAECIDAGDVGYLIAAIMERENIGNIVGCVKDEDGYETMNYIAVYHKRKNEEEE